MLLLFVVPIESGFFYVGSLFCGVVISFFSSLQSFCCCGRDFCFISLLYLDLYVLGDDALIS